MRNLDIGEVAERCGLPTSTLRFYEEKGLIQSIGRRGLRRVFAAGVVERLTLIALGRSAGFSLEEIAQMFAPDGRVRIDRQKLAAKADELDATIERLTTLGNGLRHAAACKAPSHMECPKFRRIVNAAAVSAMQGHRPEAPLRAPRAASRRAGYSPRKDAISASALVSSAPTATAQSAAPDRTRSRWRGARSTSALQKLPFSCNRKIGCTLKSRDSLKSTLPFVRSPSYTVR
jgi:DNA-binding transcriptional MerR regulator